MKNDYKTKPRNAIIGYLRAHADTRFTARDIYSAMHSEGEEADPLLSAAAESAVKNKEKRALTTKKVVGVFFLQKNATVLKIY